MKLPIYIVDAVGAPVTGLTLSGAEIKVSVDGGVLGTATGTAAEIGQGAYYYETAPGDVAGRLLQLYVRDSGASIAYSLAIDTPVAYDFPSGATGAQRYLPVFLVDSSNAPVTGAAPTGSQIQVSIDGAAWADAEGTWTELGSGEYYYNPSDDEAHLDGLLLLRVAATGAVVYGYAAFIGGDGADPTVDVVSPDENEPPGDPGAFPTDYETAIRTPIVIDLGDDDQLAYAAVHHTQQDGSRKCVYRRGEFQIGYRNGSYQETVSGKTRLHVLPDTYWQAGEVELLPDLVDAVGNVNEDG